MEQFSLEKWLENPSRKIVTRQGKSVRIICTDRRHIDSWPIVALEDYGDGEFVIYANIDGRTDMCSENIHDLFFADEKEELTKFELRLLSSLDYTRKFRRDFSNADMTKIIKDVTKELLDLARKELLKDLPKWKKATEYKEFEINEACILDDDIYPIIATNVNIGEYYLKLDELKKLPLEK